MNKIINFPMHLNKKIILDYLAPFFIFLIFFVIGLNVYKIMESRLMKTFIEKLVDYITII